MSDEELRTFCHQDPQWQNWIKSVHDVKEWQLMCKCMYSDGKSHQYRDKVLKLFTKEVVKTLNKKGHVNEALQIWTTYFEHKNKMCGKRLT